MELFNKFVWSIIEPDNTNDIWFNGKTFNIYKEGKWKPFTINVEQAEEFFKNVENTFKLYQKKLTPGRGITLEDNVISTTQLFQVVKTLPDKGEYNTIYLVLKNIPEDGDYFYEFIWVDNKWEKLGEFKQNINLEDYYTKEDIDSKNYISHTEVDEKLETKVSVEEGKGLSTNDYTDEDKEKLTTIKSKVLNIGNTTQEEVDNWKWLFDQPDCHEYCGRINLAGYNVGFYHNFKKSQNTDAYQIYVTTTDGYLYTGVLTKASIVLNQRIYFKQYYYQPTLISGVNIASINQKSLLTSDNISIYSDWDANSNSSNYIYNKPFYANWSLEKDLSSFVYDNTWQLIDSSSNIGSTTYIKYTWGNITKYVAIPYEDSNEYALNYGPPVWVKRDHDGFGIFLRSTSKHDFTIKVATSINKLSEIFLPNTAALKSDLITKQDTLISGTNIKTINGESILGEGNITISGYDDSSIQERIGNVETSLDKKASVYEFNYVGETSISQETYDAIIAADIVTWNGVVLSKQVSDENIVLSVVNTLDTGTTGKVVAELSILINSDLSTTMNYTSLSPTIPTKTSDLENDSGFLTEHQDISHLATKEELAEINTAISNKVELKYYVRDIFPVTLSSAASNSCYIYTGAAGDVRINNLANPTSSEARYEFRFSGATSLTIPSKVIWANGEVPEIDSTAYYELSIVATQTADGYVYKAVLGKFM